MTQEFKSIEEIKEEVARDYSYDSYKEFKDLTRKTDTDHIFIMDGIVNKVAQRHAQQYIDANKELLSWKESMMKVYSELDLQKIGNALDMLVGTPIAPNVLPKILELKQSNKELVEMLEELLKELRFHGFNYSTAICKAESLIAKNKQS